MPHLAAELGLLAFKRGYERWLKSDDVVADLAPYLVTALAELRESRPLTRLRCD